MPLQMYPYTNTGLRCEVLNNLFTPKFLATPKTIKKAAIFTLSSCILISSILCLLPFSAQSQSIPIGQLHITIKDASTLEQTPVRVRITQNGWVVKNTPESASKVMYGLWDHADGYDFQPDSSFYVNGYFRMNLPVGIYQLSFSKGNEYLAQKMEIVIKSKEKLQKTVMLQRWINTPEKGWFSADGHIHIRRSPREDSLLLHWIKAEDIHVGALLRMGDFWEIYFPQYAWGEKGAYQKKDYMFVSGQEDPRTPELGHVLSFGASNRVRMREAYYLYDTVLDSLASLGGLSGYAHGGETYHGYRGLILDGLRRKVDYLEILQYCASPQPLMVEHYYHLLNMGIPVTAVAGSDFPWCGTDHSDGKPEQSAQIGNARFYTYVKGELTYHSWKEAVSKGHTFVSNGPVLDFTINSSLPGDQLEVSKNTRLTIRAHAYGHQKQVPLQSLEIIGHGKVLAKITAKDLHQTAAHLSIELSLPAEKGIWLAARCYSAGNGVAHTTPIYVSVDGKGFHNPDSMDHYISLSEKYLKEIETELDTKTDVAEHQAWRYRSALLVRIEEAKEILKDLKKRINQF